MTPPVSQEVIVPSPYPPQMEKVVIIERVDNPSSPESEPLIIPRSSHATRLPDLADRIDQANCQIRSNKRLLEMTFERAHDPTSDSDNNDDESLPLSPPQKIARPSQLTQKSRNTQEDTQDTAPDIYLTFPDYLMARGLYFGPSLRDGRCLFSSIATVLGIAFSAAAADAIRMSLVAYALTRAERSEVFWKSEPRVKSLPGWAKKYSNPYEWGGDAHILLSEELFNVRIDVYRGQLPFGPARRGSALYPPEFTIRRQVAYLDSEHYLPLSRDASLVAPLQLGRADIAAFSREPDHPPFCEDFMGNSWHTLHESVTIPLTPFLQFATMPTQHPRSAPPTRKPQVYPLPLHTGCSLPDPVQSAPSQSHASAQPQAPPNLQPLPGARYPMNSAAKPAFQVRSIFELT